MQTYTLDLLGTAYSIADAEGSRAALMVAEELSRDAYALEGLHLNPGDVVLDVGGHVGLFAIYASKRWPGIQVHSFEPYPSNIQAFETNVVSCGASGITLHKSAVTGLGNHVSLAANPRNSGGATSYSVTQEYEIVHDVASVTLDDIFRELRLDQCALLKIDCEGAEYEMLRNTSVLSRVLNLRGELHWNDLLLARGWSPRQLVRDCLQVLPKERMRFSVCRMSD